MHRLLSWLVPSSALHWDRLRPLTAPTALSVLIEEHGYLAALRRIEADGEVIEAAVRSMDPLARPMAYTWRGRNLDSGVRFTTTPRPLDRSWHRSHPDPWDGGTTPRCLPRTPGP